MDKIPVSFSAIPCGNFEQLTPLITKARLRIFYLGLNRNGGYITKEFAQKLLSTLPYVPTIGDYSEEDSDFTTHREKNVANAYGVVPENPNITWENHLDKDGVERTYATCDVYLWTGRWDVAKEIIGKGQSLELDPDSIKGSWTTINGQYGFVYADARFIGLSVLGDKVEPCFEGSAFYSFINNYALAINELVNKIKEDNGGTKQMDLANYRLSHDESYRALFNLLNPNFNEANNYEYDYEIIDVYDDYVLTYKCKNKNYSRVQYSKENDVISLGEEVEVKITDVTLDEYAVLESIKANYSLNSLAEFEAKINEFSESLTAAKTSLEEKDAKIAEYENAIAEKDASISEKDSAIADYEVKNSEKDSKIVELENKVSTYELEAANSSAEIERLSGELDTFKAEKAAYELKQKEAKIAEYEEFLTNESISKVKENLDNYDLKDLEKELRNFAFEDKPELIRKNFVPSGYTPSNKGTGIISILEKYKNK